MTPIPPVHVVEIDTVKRFSKILIFLKKKIHFGLSRNDRIEHKNLTLNFTIVLSCCSNYCFCSCSCKTFLKWNFARSWKACHTVDPSNSEKKNSQTRQKEREKKSQKKTSQRKEKKKTRKTKKRHLILPKLLRRSAKHIYSLLSHIIALIVHSYFYSFSWRVNVSIYIYFTSLYRIRRKKIS